MRTTVAVVHIDMPNIAVDNLFVYRNARNEESLIVNHLWRYQAQLQIIDECFFPF